MNISKYAVKNSQFTFIMVVMVVAVGFNAITGMPRAEDPETHPPIFPVIAVYPGTSPHDMEELVVKPLEKRIYDLENIKQIKTAIRNGVAVLAVEYKYGIKVDDKYQELVRELSAIRDELPADLHSIEVQKVDPTKVNILQIALISENASRTQMKKAAEGLQDELEKLASLKEIRISGLSDQLIRVDILPDRAARMGLSLTQLTQAIQSEAANIPGGSVVFGNKSFSVKTSGSYQSLEEIRNTIVYSRDGKNIVLSDVANVYPDFAPETHITRLNRHRCVLVNAALKPGQNISASQEAYLPVIEQYKKQLPDNIALVTHFDQADNVNRRLSGLGIDFGIAITLVLITLLPLGIRASAVVMVAIPLSLSIGIILVDALGYSLNQLSIVGFVVALGLLVDDSIVVVENIERWMREGHSRLDATIKGTQQITLAVIGCTATLVIAFLPIMFMPEMSGDFIRSLPVAVISAILGSMIVALTVVPFLSSRLLKSTAHPEGNRALRIFQRVIHGTYAVVLDKAIKRPWTTLAIAFFIFVGSVMLLPVIGFSLFPSSEKPQFLINVSAPLQSNIQYTDSITRRIEQELDTMKEVKYYTSNVGKGNPQIYYNVSQRSEAADFSEIFVQLQPDTRPDRKTMIIEALRKRWTPYPGAKIEVKNFEQGIPMIAPVELKIMGDNLDTLHRLAGMVEQLLLETKGTLYVNNPIKNNKTDLRVLINTQKALAMGVPTVNIDRTVRMALAGIDLGTYTDPGIANSEYLIRMSVPRPAYPDISALNDLYVDNIQHMPVPLSQLVTLELESSAAQIDHYNKVRTVSVSSFVQNGFLNDEVIGDVVRRMDQVKLPAGYSYRMGGEVESREQSFGGFGTIILITVFLFIAVLVLEFKTFKSTLIVLSVIPLGIVGAVLALLVTGNSLSFVATIGIVALAGIEVKNTILLVDFTNHLRKEGMALNEAIEKAGEIRFLPIILTTLTAIGGLMPIAWSSNPLISPLAIVMIGGLISSTLLSRIVTPVIYKLMPPAVKPRA